MSEPRWRGRDVLRIPVRNWPADADDVTTPVDAVRAPPRLPDRAPLVPDPPADPSSHRKSSVRFSMSATSRPGARSPRSVAALNANARPGLPSNWAGRALQARRGLITECDGLSVGLCGGCGLVASRRWELPDLGVAVPRRRAYRRRCIMTAGAARRAARFAQGRRGVASAKSSRVRGAGLVLVWPRSATMPASGKRSLPVSRVMITQHVVVISRPRAHPQHRGGCQG
jgi:hypothetical protein